MGAAGVVAVVEVEASSFLLGPTSWLLHEDCLFSLW